VPASGDVRITIATCRAFPDVGNSDALYCAALRRMGAEVRIAAWNDAGRVDADSLAGSTVVLRATWDYQDDVPAFLDWMDRLEGAGIDILNPASLVRWNSDKRYLLDLQAAGIRVPATVALDPDGGLPALCDALASLGVEGDGRAVLKPAWGGGGVGVRLVSTADVGEAIERARAELPGRPLLLQGFLPGITEGEISFVFIAGRFAHAVRKRPSDGEFRVNSRYNPRAPERIEPAPHLLEDAARILGALPGDAPPLYARIDGVPDRDGRLVCLEAEVIEPDLFLDLAPETAQSFASATLEHVLHARLPAGYV
jgi:glutathione synthase/RimK-type ligase-like ATP-grasp enzyme